MASRPGADHVELPVCWLHGFAQTGRSGRAFWSILAARHEILTPDLLGMGSRGDDPGSLEEMADAVASELPASPVALVAYSLGARVALHLALRHPGRLARLVLIGATRGLASPEERERRVATDERWAIRLEEIGVDAFLTEWRRQPLFADLAEDPVEDAARLPQTVSGLAECLRRAGTGSQEFLGPRLAEITVPTLTVAGVRDDRFVREARAIAEGLPRGSTDVVPGAGHAAHLAQPSWTAQLVEAFLELSAPEST
jgi:2-succinyl-6-hydroxy-2,4-cyclohexadiene-1-carboxylate synthase